MFVHELHIRDSKILCMKSNKEIYSALHLYSFVLQICSAVGSPAVMVVKGKVCVCVCVWVSLCVCVCTVLNDVNPQGHQHCHVGLNLWTIHQECLYSRCVSLLTADALLG